MARDEINAFLGSGTVYNGDLSFEGAVRIDGVFNGSITSDGTVTNSHGHGDLWTADDDRVANNLGCSGLPLLIGASDFKAS